MEGTNQNRAVQRIQRDLVNIVKSEEFSKNEIALELVNGNFLELRGQMLGPVNTPYEGGNFILQIKVPSTYPFHPVEIRFVTKIWHPNISSVTGTICLNVLKDWLPCMTLQTALLSVKDLLSAAEPDDPQDAVVARQYKEDPELFKLTAKHWAQVYAGAPGSNSGFEDKIKRLADTGVGEEKALFALSSSFWDLVKATDLIFK